MLRILLLSLAVAGAGFGAGALTLVLRWPQRWLVRLVALGAGTLLGAAFLHLLPEAFEVAGKGATISALCGFLFLYLVERFVFTHPCEEDVCDYHKLGMMAYVGISLHSLVDGLALGTGAFLPEVTMAIFLALVLHQVPTSFALVSILVGGKFDRKKVLSYLTVISLAIPVGAVSAYAFLAGHHHRPLLGHLLGFSSGTFLDLAASDLLPEIHKEKEGKGAILFGVFSGVAMMALLAWAVETH